VPGTTGWRSQQVLKLCVAALVESDAYVVLDAKNHFVAPMSADFFRAPDGRARVTAYGYRSHPLRASLEKVLAYLGLDPEPYLDRFTATVTPFVLETAMVRDLIDGVASESGRSFPEEFVKRELTEFFLYSGWVLRTGQSLEEFFDLQDTGSPTIWPKGATLEGVRAALAQSAERGGPVFAVHRRALAALTPDGAGELARFWADTGLFDTEELARTFISDYARAFRKEARLQKIREVPLRALVLARRIQGTLARTEGRAPHASA
jgi:hypothetical protein